MQFLLLNTERFGAGEFGAITTDWIVLCAGLVAMAIAVTAIFGQGSADHAERIDSCLSGMSDEAELTEDAHARAEAMKEACNDAAAS